LDHSSYCGLRDLTIMLLSPYGNSVELGHGQEQGASPYWEYGDGGNLYKTSFDDEASNSIYDGIPPYAGVFQPEGTLSDFDGQSSNGTWQMLITNSSSASGTVEFTIEIDYGIIADFSADYNSILTGTEVQFTDLTEGNPTVWEWDFDNDGIIDSYEQNPQWIYYTRGNYTVSLTVFDENYFFTEVKENYVELLNSPPTIQNPIVALFFSEDTSNTSIDLNNVFDDSDMPYGDELSFSYSGNINVQIEIIDGQVTLTPNSDWFGIEDIILIGIDDENESVSDEVTITVEPVNDPPEVDLPLSFTLYKDESLVVDFAAFVSDIEGDELSLTVNGNNNIIIEITDLMVTFSVLNDWSGEETVTFTAFDGVVRAIASDEITIIALDIPFDPLLILPDSFAFNEDEFLTVEFMDYLSDVNVDSLSLTIENNEAINTVISGTEVEFSAIENWYGSEEIAISIFGIQGRFTTSDSVVIIVQPVNDAPEINLPAELYLDRQGELTIDLTDYAFDIDNDALLYTVITGEALEVEIFGSLASISSGNYWSGMENIIFCVDDEQNRLAACDTVLVIREINQFPVIESIIDVPDDQGGKVIVEFTGSCLDTDSLIVRYGEMYQVEYLYNNVWLAANSTIAYGAEIYTVLVNTLQDSIPGNPNIFDFRIIAAMEEGNFVSNLVSGYSLDNLCPQVPAELYFEGGRLVWSAPVDEDFTFFSIYCSEELLEYSIVPELIVIGEMGEYRVTAVDCHANESEFSVAIFGGYPYGDCNHNLEVEAIDASIILQYFCQIISDWENWQIEVCDVDGNGVVEAYDASLVLQFTVGFIDEFPVE